MEPSPSEHAGSIAVPDGEGGLITEPVDSFGLMAEVADGSCPG
ncbi:hypothetical protein [Streptomyces gossypii]|nr:hypothetical protein [Streptomyces gossypii]